MYRKCSKEPAFLTSNTEYCVMFIIIHSVPLISRIIKVSVKFISLGLQLIIPTSTLIILHITKTSSNNYHFFKKSVGLGST